MVYPQVVKTNPNQWPFQDPKPEVPATYKAHVREYPHKPWLYMVQYLHFRILEFPLTKCSKSSRSSFQGTRRGCSSSPASLQATRWMDHWTSREPWGVPSSRWTPEKQSTEGPSCRIHHVDWSIDSCVMTIYIYIYDIILIIYWYNIDMILVWYGDGWKIKIPNWGRMNIYLPSILMRTMVTWFDPWPYVRSSEEMLVLMWPALLCKHPEV